MTEKYDQKIPLKQALSWIIFSILLISGSAALSLIYFRHVKEMHMQDDAYRVVGIIQTTTNKEALNTVYLAELLDLSLNRPTNLYKFSCKEAQRKLKTSPLIKEAVVKKVRPGIVYIDYQMRYPIAYLIDYDNAAIDLEGVPFPVYPFFTPKKLPEVHLGLANGEASSENDHAWGIPIKGKNVALALEVLEHLATSSPVTTVIKRIDVASAYAPSCGQRQIIVILEELITREEKGKIATHLFPRILRLSTEEYKQGIANYHRIQEHLVKEDFPASTTAVMTHQPLFIDLRLPNLAFMNN